MGVDGCVTRRSRWVCMLCVGLCAPMYCSPVMRWEGGGKVVCGKEVVGTWWWWY
jgi:hypothetical protein